MTTATTPSLVSNNGGGGNPGERRERLEHPPDVAKNHQDPLPYGVAARAEARCAVRTAVLLAQRRIHQPSQHVGLGLRFADGTSARVYRETVVDGAWRRIPASSWSSSGCGSCAAGDTPSSAGRACSTPRCSWAIPGFVSKLWLAHDQHGVYRGLYEWDGAERAEHYARCLWRVLALGSVPGSIHYRVVPGLRRDEVLAAPHLLAAVARGGPGSVVAAGRRSREPRGRSPCRGCRPDRPRARGAGP